MSKQNDNLLAAIDLGTSKTVAIMAEVADGALRYRGHGIVETRGVRKGTIVDLEKATSSVEKAVAEAENMASMAVERAIVGITGQHIRGINSQGGISLGARVRDITKDDIRQAIERARAVTLPPDREVIHLMQQDFTVDDQSGIQDPEGMTGTKLGARVHLITSASIAAQNSVTVLNRAGIEVEDQAFTARASADAVLRSDEKELGVCLIDIGAGSTDLIVIHSGYAIYSASIPVGGIHFTNDLAVGLCTPLADAEVIKKNFGCAVVTSVPEAVEIEVPSVGDRPPRMESQRRAAEFLQERARDLFMVVRDNLRQAGLIDSNGRGQCEAGYVLTGGAAVLPGLSDIVDSVLHKPARIGVPAALPKMPEELMRPEFSTAIGLVLCAYMNRARRTKPEKTGFFKFFQAMIGRK